MISHISFFLTKKLLDKNIVSPDEKELYEYGIFLIGSYLFFGILSITVGLILKIPLEAFLFFIVFCSFRSLAGGIHAKSEITCNIITTSVIIIGELLIKVIIYNELFLFMFIMLCISSVLFVMMNVEILMFGK